MIQYSADGLTAFYGGYKFRKDKKTGYYLCNKKTDIGKRERLHCFVWRMENGDIPKGYHIHHKNENKDDNEINNLELLSSSAHCSFHSNNWSDERKKKQIEILLTKGVPASKAWHRSEEGRKWHKENGEKAFSNRKERTYKCDYCGNEFKTKFYYNEKQHTFCCNNCRAAYRRKIGVDDVTRICKICGQEYKANKYARTSRCPCCRHKRNKGDRQG